jgi:hypothetical protein
VTRLTVGARKGKFGGANAKRDITVKFHGLSAKPKTVTVDGKAVEGAWCEKSRVFTVAAVEVGSKGAVFEVKADQ